MLLAILALFTDCKEPDQDNKPRSPTKNMINNTSLKTMKILNNEEKIDFWISDEGNISKVQETDKHALEQYFTITPINQNTYQVLLNKRFTDTVWIHLNLVVKHNRITGKISYNQNEKILEKIDIDKFNMYLNNKNPWSPWTINLGYGYEKIWVRYLVGTYMSDYLNVNIDSSDKQILWPTDEKFINLWLLNHNLSHQYNKLWYHSDNNTYIFNERSALTLWIYNLWSNLWITINKDGTYTWNNTIDNLLTYNDIFIKTMSLLSLQAFSDNYHNDDIITITPENRELMIKYFMILTIKDHISQGDRIWKEFLTKERGENIHLINNQ